MLSLATKLMRLNASAVFASISACFSKATPCLANNRIAGLHNTICPVTSSNRCSTSNRSTFAVAKRITFHASSTEAGFSNLAGTGTSAHPSIPDKTTITPAKQARHPTNNLDKKSLTPPP